MIFTPSGGLRYHLRAARSARLWRETRDDIAAWLDTWNASSELIIFGASGGYMLDPKWLAQFRDIKAYDFDSLAPAIFALRHRRIPFFKKNLFFVDGNLSLAPLEEILNANPHASLLFSNILGQVPLEGNVQEKEWTDYLSALRFRLQARTWASVHDLWTFEPLPLYAHPVVFKTYKEQGDARLVFAGASNAKVEAIDHLTGGAWVANLKTRLFPWSLTKNSLHVLAGVHSEAGA